MFLLYLTNLCPNATLLKETVFLDLLTFLEDHMRYESSAEGAWRAVGPALCQCPQTWLTEHMAAGLTHVWLVVHVQTHGTHAALLLLFITACKIPAHTLQTHTHTHHLPSLPTCRHDHLYKCDV